jgi:hypothetical protein
MDHRDFRLRGIRGRRRLWTRSGGGNHAVAPDSFARSRCASARPISESTESDAWSAATPRLIVARSGFPSNSYLSCSTRTRIRSQNRAASSMPVSGSTTANSSPP